MSKAPEVDQFDAYYTAEHTPAPAAANVSRLDDIREKMSPADSALAQLFGYFMPEPTGAY